MASVETTHINSGSLADLPAPKPRRREPCFVDNMALHDIADHLGAIRRLLEDRQKEKTEVVLKVEAKRSKRR